MDISTRTVNMGWPGALAGAFALVCQAAWAAPTVNIVPGSAVDPSAPHEVISGRPTTLKAAVNADCAGVCTWTWNPGDGNPSYTGNVDLDPTTPAQMDDPGYNPYWAIWAEHTYAGSSGDLFIASLTVDDGVNPPVSATYRVSIVANTLPREVNAAIEEALWHMHRNQFRFLGTDTGATGGTIPMGRWDYPQSGGTVSASVSGASVNAFEANGFLETGTSPYADTVRRGLAYLFSQLTSQAINVQTVGTAGRSDDPDANANGIGVYVNGIDPPYQGGMLMDAIIAAGTPGAIAAAGPSPNVKGRSYGDIIQDMTDWYAWAQSDSASHGGWQYGAFNNSGGAHDNSASGWAAIGLVAAEDVFGTTVPQWVKDRNIVGLEFTDNESDVSDNDGIIGYTSTGAVWGQFGVTGAGMVQMVMDDIQATSSATPDERWVRAENHFRRHFNDAASGNNLKNYYYAMFNFAKAMRLARPGPVVNIGTVAGAIDGGVGCGPNPGCAAGGPASLDWYNHVTDGLARTVVDYQVTTGVNIGGFTDRPGNSHGSNQDDHNTPWATQILTRTIIEPGPIAIAEANPNPTGEGVPVTLDGTGSFHLNPARNIVLYEWDFDGDNVFDASGPVVVQPFVCDPPGALPCVVPVTLRVTDDSNPALTANDVVNIEITIPPHPPVADADGPYLTCLDEQFSLDGSGSFDIDEGTSETGDPPFDTITAYEWDLDLASGPPFDSVDTTGVTPLFTLGTEAQLDIALRVTDNTSQAFPTAQSPDLTDTDSTQLDVFDCSCMGPIQMIVKPRRVQLIWDPVPGAASYDIRRSLLGANRAFNLIKENHVTGFATYLDRVVLGQRFWYRITPKDASGNPICGSSRAVNAQSNPRDTPRRTR